MKGAVAEIDAYSRKTPRNLGGFRPKKRLVVRCNCMIGALALALAEGATKKGLFCKG